MSEIEVIWVREFADMKYGAFCLSPIDKIAKSGQEEIRDYIEYVVPILGKVPTNHTVVVTTGLREILSAGEIKAVLDHERGHIFHQHFTVEEARVSGIARFTNELAADQYSVLARGNKASVLKSAIEKIVNASLSKDVDFMREIVFAAGSEMSHRFAQLDVLSKAGY